LPIIQFAAGMVAANAAMSRIVLSRIEHIPLFWAYSPSDRALNRIDAPSHALRAGAAVFEVAGDIDTVRVGERPTVARESKTAEHVNPWQAASPCEFDESLVGATFPSW
ncbi:hypothetical protein, partial [Ensifer aridi]|uniref:hypothetical protein n=1 Tax=Ensifer aridi TaxID=1708715 RepID=UPI001AECA656